MRLTLSLVAILATGCATQAPYSAQDKYLQFVDPMSGNLVMEVAAATPEGCRIVQAQIGKANKEAGGMFRCAPASAATSLSHRATLRVKTTGYVQDWHFLNADFCQAALKGPQLSNFDVVADCSAK